jgi:hypothetical protein
MRIADAFFNAVELQMESATFGIKSVTCEYGNLNILECGDSFFHGDTFGEGVGARGTGEAVIIEAFGLKAQITTDISSGAGTGKPREVLPPCNCTKV